MGKKLQLRYIKNLTFHPKATYVGDVQTEDKPSRTTLSQSQWRKYWPTRLLSNENIEALIRYGCASVYLMAASWNAPVYVLKGYLG